jgi:hypothetical protein
MRHRCCICGCSAVYYHVCAYALQYSTVQAHMFRVASGSWCARLQQQAWCCAACSLCWAAARQLGTGVILVSLLVTHAAPRTRSEARICICM